MIFFVDLESWCIVVVFGNAFRLACNIEIEYYCVFLLTLLYLTSKYYSARKIHEHIRTKPGSSMVNNQATMYRLSGSQISHVKGTVSTFRVPRRLQGSLIPTFSTSPLTGEGIVKKSDRVSIHI